MKENTRAIFLLTLAMLFCRRVLLDRADGKSS